MCGCLDNSNILKNGASIFLEKVMSSPVVEECPTTKDVLFTSTGEKLKQRRYVVRTLKKRIISVLNAVPASRDGTVLKGVQRIIMEEDAGQNATVLKHRFVFLCGCLQKLDLDD